jgi:hypothetical protein
MSKTNARSTNMRPRWGRDGLGRQFFSTKMRPRWGRNDSSYKYATPLGS